jgi:CheY-like chemotaxis protein
VALEKGVVLHDRVTGQLPAVLADRDRVNQVLTNLIHNAIKFTPAGGAITLSAQTNTHRRPVIGILEPGEAPPGAFHGMESHEPETGSYLVISVRDTGIGIRAEDQERIFDKFGQVGNILTDKPQGTGLGLAISGSIVMQHGGALWVESSPDDGSVFSFSLPVEASSAPSRGAGSTPAPVESDHTIVRAVRRSTPGKQILVVDDEPAIVSALTELLQPCGYRVVGCQSGSQAVARARELQPDAIILDIMMPEINGYDVLRLLKGDPSTAGIPVIVLSVLDDKQKAFELGATEYVRKPFEKDVLLDNVRALA